MLVGPVWIAALVLAGAGFGKLTLPSSTLGAVRSLGRAGTLLGRPILVRAFGAVELVVAVAAVWVGGRTSVAMLCAVWVVLALVADRLRRAGAADCGCFGRAAAPVGWGHVLVNSGTALWTAAAVFWPVGGLTATWPRLPALGIPHVIGVAAGTMAVVALLTVLPAVRAAARPPADDPRVHLFGPTIPLGRPA